MKSSTYFSYIYNFTYFSSGVVISPRIVSWLSLAHLALLDQFFIQKEKKEMDFLFGQDVPIVLVFSFNVRMENSRI